MQRKYKTLFTGLLLFLFLLVISACSSESVGNSKESTENAKDESTENESTTQKGGELTIAYHTDISNFDPIKGSSGFDHALLWPVYDTLIKFNSQLEPQPGLAESWEIEEDKTIVLHLREDVTFHDGTPFDAKAVKFNLERANSKDSTVTDLKSIKSVEVVDEKTVKLHLSEPDASVLLALTDRGGMMVSPTAVEKSGEEFSQNPVGAGPYKMVKRVPNGEIVFEAYENYWQEGQPYLDTMTVKIMEEENTRINALKSGEVDFIENISPANYGSLEKDPNLTIKDILSLTVRNMYINAAQTPLDNKAVRQAINYGINREQLIQAINFGKGEPATQVFPPGFWATDDSIELPYDPEKAKKLLKDAGIENPTITIVHYSNAYEARLAEAIKGQLGEIGIQVELQSMETIAATTAFFHEKKFQATITSLTGRPDPQIATKILFAKGSIYNAGGYSTDEIEKLINEAASVYDQAERAKLYGEIARKAVLEEAISIPLFFSPYVAAMNSKVKGYEPNMLGKPIFSDIWLEQK